MVDLSFLPTSVEVVTLTSVLVIIIRSLTIRLGIALEEKSIANILSVLILILLRVLMKLHRNMDNAHNVKLLDKMHNDIITMRDKLRKKDILG